MLKIRRPLGRLIFNMGIGIPGKTVFLIETAPRSLFENKDHPSRYGASHYKKEPIKESIIDLAHILHWYVLLNRFIIMWVFVIKPAVWKYFHRMMSPLTLLNQTAKHDSIISLGSNCWGNNNSGMSLPHNWCHMWSSTAIIVMVVLQWLSSIGIAFHNNRLLYDTSMVIQVIWKLPRNQAY